MGTTVKEYTCENPSASAQRAKIIIQINEESEVTPQLKIKDQIYLDYKYERYNAGGTLMQTAFAHVDFGDSSLSDDDLVLGWIRQDSYNSIGINIFGRPNGGAWNGYYPTNGGNCYGLTPTGTAPQYYTFSEDAPPYGYFIPMSAVGTYGTDVPENDYDIIYITTNIPIFDSYDASLNYRQSGGTDTSDIQNTDRPITSTNFKYFIKNTVSKNGSIYRYADYRFETNSANDPHKMCLVKAPNGVGYDYTLQGQHASVITKILQRNRQDNANDYAETSSADTEYLKNSQTMASGTFYHVDFWRTNIYCFDNQNDADEYLNTGNTDNATNTKDVNRANDTIVDGHIGDVVNQTDNGTSGISFAYGGQIYALSSVNLASFFTNVLFSTDTDIKDAILKGTQLFGSNQINAINGCMYLPITDISDIASVSSVNKCFIGTYEAPITAQRVVANDKMIDCGSAVFEPTYGDVRDYEPYCKLYVMLPYCGTHELTISKYIGKTVSLKYAVDVTTGACTAYLYANNVIMDSFDGTMGVQRPITAVNQQAQVSSIINGIMGTAESVSKTVGTAGMAIAGGSALSSATTGAKAISASGEIANAGTNFGGGVQGTILQGYNALQASMDAPMSTRGAFSGVLGQFGNQYPYFIFAWLKTSKPANEVETVGLPSNAGGAVGNFGGFLQCSAFNLANGFTGTDNEANEIYSIMSSGVYVS